MGQPLTANLRLTNASDDPVRVPWSVDHGIVFGKNCEWLPKPGAAGLMSTISLVLTDTGGYKQFIAGHGLYGISTSPATYRTLRPHGTLDVRMGGKIDLHDIIVQRREAGLPLALPQSFTVTAIFDWSDGGFGKYRQVPSNNRLRVILVEK